MLQIILNTIQTAQVHNVNVQISASMHRSVMINVMFSSAELIRYSSAAYTSQIFSTASKARSLGKPARLIIRVLFGFASDLTNSTNLKNLQIVRRQCCLLQLPSAQSYTSTVLHCCYLIHIAGHRLAHQVLFGMEVIL